MESSKGNKYPQTDREIRIYCIETVQDPFCGYSEEYVEQARKLYDFITEIPLDATEGQQAPRSLSLARKRWKFPWRKNKKPK